MVFRNPTTKFANPAQLNADEIAFLESIKPWEKKHWSTSFGTADQNRRRNLIKDKFKSELETIQGNYCAFCGLHLSKVYKIHREHIAPQYKHEHYIFEPENIVLACSYCNDYKGKKLTVDNDTNDYSTTTFTILHPFRDNFSDFIECDFARRELIFSIKEGLTRPEIQLAQNTIDCFGLIEPNLIRFRGMIIFCHSYPISPDEDEAIKEIISINRKAS